MRTLLATATALTVGLVLTSGLRADDKDNDKTNKDSQSNKSQTQTIHGIVAGVTVEGETAIDYQSNKAVMLESAYLTVVGSPGHGHQGGDADHNRGNQGDQNAKNNSNNSNHHGSANSGGRHNVYLVWLSPKTKVCEANNAGNSGGNANANSGNKKECSLDKLEVGDRVEIKMTSRSESSTNNQGTPTEEMRKKHGRNRIYVGDATEITILAAPREHGSSGNQGNNNSDQNSSKGDKNNSSDNNSSDKGDK